MPILPKLPVETETVSVRIPKPILADLDAYCAYLGGATDRTYLIIEAIREVIARDRKFQKAQRTGPTTAAPAPVSAPASHGETLAASTDGSTTPGAKDSSGDPESTREKDKRKAVPPGRAA
jgi:hypothetical protein